MAVKDTTISHKVDVPHEPGEWIEFRELGWKALDTAQQVRARNSLMSFRDLGPEFLKSLSEGDDTAESPKKVNPGENYDKSALLRTAILNWSYPVECTEANIDNLDPTTADWAFDEIIKIHFPTEDELGKASASSSVRSVEDLS